MKNKSSDVITAGNMESPGLLLTKHEGESLVSQSIHLSGHGFKDCKFENCTLIVTNTPFIIEGCEMINCNWRFEYNVLWGDPLSREGLRQILDLIDGRSPEKSECDSTSLQ